MMRAGKFRKSLLILALVLSQWLVFAHAFQHPVLNADEQVCQICLHAQGLDSGGIGLLPQLPALAGAIEAPAITLPALPARPRPTLYLIRGPPLLT